MAHTTNIEFCTEMDRGLAYAESCFETFRVIDGAIFQWPAHWSRLSFAMHSFGLAVEATAEDELHRACLSKAAQTARDCLLRLTVSGGSAPWGLLGGSRASYFIQAMPFQPGHEALHLSSLSYPFPLRAKVAKYSADYSDSLRAIQLWKQQQPDCKPLQCVIEKDGHIISGLTANILLYVNEQWLTPAGDGILPGVTRAFLLERQLVQATPCPATMLDECRAIILLNSGQFVRVASSINCRKLLTDHPAISSIQQAFAQQPGVALEANPHH